MTKENYFFDRLSKISLENIMGRFLFKILLCAAIIFNISYFNGTIQAMEGVTTTENLVVMPIKERISLLREKFQGLEIEGFFIPHTDDHQNEYIPGHADRLGWLTGFNCSFGDAIVLSDGAAFFTDSRYFEAAKEKVSKSEAIKIENIRQIPRMAQRFSLLCDWLKESGIDDTKIIGYDPWLYTENQKEDLETKAPCKLMPLDKENPIDQIWKRTKEETKIYLYPEQYAGKPSVDKRREITDILKSKGADMVILSKPSLIAWLLNIRADDIPYTPVPLAYALLYKEGKVDLFIDSPNEITSDVQRYFENNDITLFKERKLITRYLSEIQKGNVMIDPDSTPFYLVNILKENMLKDYPIKLIRESDPCELPQVIKNEIELQGMRKAHWRDGVALTKFICWLEKEVFVASITEIDAAKKLDQFREDVDKHEPIRLLKGLSFATISGTGGHGAIHHYEPTEEDNAVLKLGQLYVVDSGAQYLDGTTDVTRTVALGGQPTLEQRDRFTRVLKGYIAMSNPGFPKNISVKRLDSLARQFLWQVGLDYGHGTSHGVGCFLGVHDGPSKVFYGDEPLKPGMVLSIEPGYYKTNEYGIRIENLVEVIGQGETLSFLPLTLAPLDNTLIDLTLLSSQEIDWVNNYHTKVYRILSSYLKDDAETLEWLQRATEKL